MSPIGPFSTRSGKTVCSAPSPPRCSSVSRLSSSVSSCRDSSRPQRDQIGVLKAFGYDHRTSPHTTTCSLPCWRSLGALIGTGTGLWLGAQINRMYTEVYRFPVLQYARAQPCRHGRCRQHSGSAARCIARRGAHGPYHLPRPCDRNRRHASCGLVERTGIERLLEMGHMIVCNLTRCRCALVTSASLAVGDSPRALSTTPSVIIMGRVRLCRERDVTLTATIRFRLSTRRGGHVLPGAIRALSLCASMFPARTRRFGTEAAGLDSWAWRRY